MIKRKALYAFRRRRALLRCLIAYEKIPNCPVSRRSRRHTAARLQSKTVAVSLINTTQRNKILFRELRNTLCGRQHKSDDEKELGRPRVALTYASHNVAELSENNYLRIFRRYFVYLLSKNALEKTNLCTTSFCHS